MCGIAGIYKSNGIDKDILLRMSETIKHRGPDDEGYMLVDSFGKASAFRGRETVRELSHLKFVSENAEPVKLALIHRRLSIIDLKPTGHQPMIYSKNNSWITYNGEIYNYVELREELKKLGYEFKTDSDTEVILAGYEAWSSECVNHFIGMWSFVIYDCVRNLLFCSRDRFGIKPFYYYYNESGFAFSSEIKALLALPDIIPQLETGNSIEYIVNSNQYFNEKTFFRNINQLEPGFNLIYQLASNKFQTYSYYQLNINETLHFADFNEAVSELGRLINDSIHLHLRSDVPVGTCLSGGLDSSTIIVELLNENLPYKPKTFTASFPGSILDEVSYIKKIKLKHEFSDNYIIPDPHNLWEKLDIFLWHQDLPVQSSSPFAQWEVMSLAQKNTIKVLLDGQGMDEIIGGYSEFVGAFLLGQILHGHFLQFIANLSYLIFNYKTSSVFNEIFRASFHSLPPYFQTGIYSSQRIGPSIIGSKYKSFYKNLNYGKRIGNSIKETSLNSVKNVLPVLLRYEDRNSMAFSIESRVPYLDHRIVEFCLNLPDSYKIYKGWTKYIFRKHTETILPKEITWRKEKLGFITPERQWLDVLSKEFKSLLKEDFIPDIINADFFESLLNSNIKNKINLGEIWKVILFIRWMKVFNISIY